MRLPDQVQKCVVFFGLRLTDPKTGIEQISYRGTGFFVGIPSDIPGATFTVLVTASHIAKKLEHGQFFIRANKKDGTAVEYAVEGGTDAIWRFHPSDDSVDAAMAIWSPPPADDVDYLSVSKNMFLDPVKIEAKGIGTGDEIYVTGLFRLLYGAQRNLPIVRTGNLAMLPTDRVPVHNGLDVSAYLIEARSIGGSSGSPVFVQRSIRVQAIESTGREPLAAGAIFWLGLVLGHWDERRVQAADDWGYSIEVGLTVVVPCHHILQILEGEAIQAEMGERETALETEYHEAVMDGGSPSEVSKSREELAAAIMSAPGLTDAVSAMPSLDEIFTGRASPTHAFDPARPFVSEPSTKADNPTHEDD